MSEKLLQSLEAGVLTLTINKPEVRNAIDPEVMDELRAALQTAGADSAVRVVVLTGAGGHFCSGADIKAAMATREGQSVADKAYEILTQVYGPTQMAIRDCPKPVIAAIEGYAAGFGCDLALRCDLRLMSETAVLAELFVRVGLIPDGGGTYLLPRLLGLGRALEVMLTGRNVSAGEALQWGLANQVLPSEGFSAAAQTFAASLAQHAPLALAKGKQAMIAALEGTYAEALQREADLQREIFNSEDGLEGFMAFMEKRPPVWKGR